MVQAVKGYIELIKNNQKARDLILAEIEDLQKSAEEITVGIISSIAFLQTVRGKLNDPEAEELIEQFLNEHFEEQYKN